MIPDNIEELDNNNEIDYGGEMDDDEEDKFKSENVSLETDKINSLLVGLTFIGNNISNESFPVFIKNISNFFITKLYKVKEIFNINNTKHKNFNNDSKRSSLVKDLMSLKSQLNTVVKLTDYSSVKDLNVYSMPGLKVDLIKLLVVLEEAMVRIGNEYYGHIDALDHFVQQLLGDANFRLSSRPIKPETAPIELENYLYRKLNEVIDTRLVKDQDKIEKLIPNISSLISIVDSLYKLGVGQTLDNLKMLDERIDSIVSNINILQEEMNSNKYEVSKFLMTKLAADLESNAKLTTVVISYTQLYNQTVLCVSNIIKVISDRK